MRRPVSTCADLRGPAWTCVDLRGPAWTCIDKATAPHTGGPTLKSTMDLGGVWTSGKTPCEADP